METIIKKIRNDFLTNGRVTIQNETDVSSLMLKHPKLFDMITNARCDENMLMQVLKLYTKIKSGELSPTDGDKIMGECAAEKYVFPLIDKSKENM